MKSNDTVRRVPNLGVRVHDSLCPSFKGTVCGYGTVMVGKIAHPMIFVQLDSECQGYFPGTNTYIHILPIHADNAIVEEENTNGA